MSYAREIKHDTSSLARTAGDSMADTASNLAEKAGETFESAKTAASDAASGAMERGREAGRQFDAVATNLKGAVDKSVRDQPMATLAVAALAGFVLGAIWKS